MSYDSAWTRSVASRRQDVINTFYNNLNSAESYIPAAVLGIQNGQGQLDTAKRNVTNAVTTLSSLAREATERLNSATSQIEQSSQELETSNTSKAKTQKEVSSARTILELRKAQVAALRHKNDGNYHSNWLGLWRPLHEATQTGLLIAAITLGIVSLIVIGFLVYVSDITSAIPALVGRISSRGAPSMSSSNAFSF
jgi:uncharacterized iron-regulated membrane protein